MKIKYIPTKEFIHFIKSRGDKAQLKSIDGHFRWVISDEEEEYIARPEEALEKVSWFTRLKRKYL